MTSEDLLRDFPFLTEQTGWKGFAEAFDKRECVKKRAVAREVHEGAEPSPMVLKLRSLISRISWDEASRGPVPESGLEDVFLSDEEVLSLRKYALALSDVVALFLSASDKGEQLRDIARKEVLRQKKEALPPGEREIRMGHEALLALRGFVERERRLPSKSELNLEAGRRHRVSIRIDCHLPVPHGKQYQWQGRVLRVQGSQPRVGVEGLGTPPGSLPVGGVFDCLVDFYEIELIDCTSGNGAWNDPRWAVNTLSKEVVMPFGFSGLPRHRKR